jgi:putative membrane protein
VTNSVALSEALSEALSGAASQLPPLTVSSSLTAFRLDLPAVLTTAVALWLYLGGVHRLRSDGRRWSILRTVAFVAGLVVVLIATCGFFGVYAHVLFWAYTLQVCLLLIVAPLLIGAGNPIALSTAASGESGRRGLARAARSPLLRVARAPGVGPAVLIAVTAVVFFSPAMEWSLRSTAGYHVLHAVLLIAGLVLALPITDESVSFSSNAYAAMLGLGVIEFLLDAVPGIVLRLQNHVISAGYWLTTGRTWGPSPLADQRLAGSWLWFFAEAGDLPFIAALLVAWVRSDAREARSIDAALDRAHPLPADSCDVVGPGPDGARPDPDQGVLMRPWWESDPSVFGEERARRSGWTQPDPDRPAPPRPDQE